MPTMISPAAVTLASTATWEAVDANDYGVPSGASGVICRFVNGSGNGNVGFRKAGSSDALLTTSISGRTGYFCIGLDGSGVFEFNRFNVAVTLDIIGYFGSEAVFPTNAIAKSGINSSFTYTDVDISADTTGTALAAFVWIDQSQLRAIRQNGSTDNLTGDWSAGTAIVGVDGSEIFEINTNSNGQTIYVVGYMTAGVTWNTNATDRSLGSTGAFTDLSALPAGAIAGLYRVAGTGAAALRRNGSSENLSANGLGDCHAVVECDGSQLVEGNISSTGIDFYELGYLTAVSPATTTGRGLLLGVG